jgi:hypothetical protein
MIWVLAGVCVANAIMGWVCGRLSRRIRRLERGR